MCESKHSLRIFLSLQKQKFISTKAQPYIMKISNRVKRNISCALTILGCVIIVAQTVTPIMNKAMTRQDWLNIIGALVITYCAFDNFKIYRKRVREGIIFGSKPA